MDECVVWGRGPRNVHDVSLAAPVPAVRADGRSPCVGLCVPLPAWQTPGCSSSHSDNGGLRCGCTSKCGFMNMTACVCVCVRCGLWLCVQAQLGVCNCVCGLLCVSARLEPAGGVGLGITWDCLSESAWGSGAGQDEGLILWALGRCMSPSMTISNAVCVWVKSATPPTPYNHVWSHRRLSHWPPCPAPSSEHFRSGSTSAVINCGH